MCQKATEIQELWKPKTGDYTDHGIHYPNLINRFYEISYIWLPRQDQLQDMVWNKWYHGDVTGNFNEFNVWQKMNWIWGNSSDNQWFSSAEQLWFAFAMHKKYGKKWNGENWIINKGD